MGGGSKTLQALLAQAPRAVHAGTVPLGPSGWLICDALTRDNLLRNKGRSTFTTLELLREWLKAVLRDATATRAGTIVLVYDDNRKVPREKSEEQKRRRTGREQYPAEAVLTAEGLRETPNGPAEAFDVNRMLSSHTLRPQFFACLRAYLYVNARVLPAGLTVILDATFPHPWAFSAHKGAVPLTDIRRTLGEADLQCVWWLRRVPPVIRVAVQSIDTDMLPILLWWRHSAHPAAERNVCWVQRKDCYLTVNDLLAGVRDGLKLTLEQFLLAMICNGNDFVDKGALLFWINETATLRAAQHCRGLDDVSTLVQRAHTTRYYGEAASLRSLADLQREADAQAKPTSHRVPTAETVAAVQTRIRDFLAPYWFRDWSGA